MRFLFFSCTFAAVLLALIAIVGCTRQARESKQAVAEPKGESQTNVGHRQSDPLQQREPLDRHAEFTRSDKAVQQGDYQTATAALRRLLLVDPEDAEAIFRLANVSVAQGHLAEAFDLLDSIPEDHPDAGMAAVGRSADLAYELEYFEQAERRYFTVIKMHPSANLARRRLAQLLNRQGRRHEAATQLQELCKAGDIQHDELHALLSLSDATTNSDQADTFPGNDASMPIGAAGRARELFTALRYAEAAEQLQELAATTDLKPAINAFYGRVLVEAQQDELFLQWLGSADDSTRVHAEYWAALGAYLVNERRFEEAVRALAEALSRDGTDARSLKRINQSLLALGKKDAAKLWFDRYVTTREIALASNQIVGESPPTELFTDLISGLESIGRPLEAVLWRSIEAYYNPGPKPAMVELNRQRVQLVETGKGFPDLETRLCNLDLKSYALPGLDRLIVLSPTSPRRQVDRPVLRTPKFKNIADSIGLRHAYQVASKQKGKAFAIYQSVGGGVAVLDYDLNGQPDLYFAQGGADPPSMIGTQSNILYRQSDLHLNDVTVESGAQDVRYSIGVTAGDWNQDGFTDLVVANLGSNALLVNNGDGTFTSEATDRRDDPTFMTTSLAIGDVTGDALPDLVELNYIHDSEFAREPVPNEQGELEYISPLGFNPALDRVLVNDGFGQRISTYLASSEKEKRTGLGILMADLDGKPGNEIFVGNDVRPDQLWSYRKDDGWVDTAITAGCAYGNSGSTVASMGIAAGDFDLSGTLDLHITNFENETACLYVNFEGLFQDQCVKFGLVQDSRPTLGFGCQALDFANNGWPDLIVTNGHVENAQTPGHQFEQPLQVFANQGGRFELVPVEDPSGYCGGLHVGRALATVDYNRDGKMDFVVTHIEAQSALLLNQDDNDNHWLAVDLVGTVSERDAIGAHVTVSAGERKWTRWMTSGDGFLCRNDPVLTFGLGDLLEVDRLQVTWPNGKKQSYGNIGADQRLLLVENQPEIFVMESQSQP